MLSIHTVGDLFVPLSMKQIYAQRSKAQGTSNLLVQRAIRDHNHCGFVVPEEEAAFTTLVNWVTNGVKPDGDDILTPAAVADPKFGCKFALAGHALSPILIPFPTEQAGHDQGADVTAIRLHFAAVPGVQGGKARVSDDGDGPAPF